MNKIILTVNDEQQAKQLNMWYNEAVQDAVELYVLTAYLTAWPVKKPLSSNCKRLLILVGTDFGLTRKNALRDVLKWLPNSDKSSLMAIEGTQSFHPKLLMWDAGHGKRFLVVGSSNISLGGFEKNVEANIKVEITQAEFKSLRDKVIYLRNNHAIPVSEDWIKSYTESIVTNNKRGKKKKKSKVIKPDKPCELDISILMRGHTATILRKRRRQQNSFAEIKKKLTNLVKQCAEQKMSDATFYEKMFELWGNHSSRFQGEGFQIWGKNSRWHQTCKSLLKIINAGNLDIFEMDTLVKNEINYLQNMDNRTRSSWLSEMICHFYPESYPVLNKPVKDWLKDNNYKAPHKSSDGVKYIDITLKLRNSLKVINSGISNMAEMDTLIWRWHDNKYG